MWWIGREGIRKEADTRVVPHRWIGMVLRAMILRLERSRSVAWPGVEK